MFNKDSLDTVCSALCYAMGVEPPKYAAAPNEAMVRYIDETLGEKKADRVFMYNPDAVAQWIMEDKHDLIVCYNGNYDYWQHIDGPEGLRPLTELRANSHAFGLIDELIRDHWQKHNTLLGFAMDHGCHKRKEPKVCSNGDLHWGLHYYKIPEDMNIVHRYMIHKAGE